jgi:ribosomal protein S18 acetylase RimI-like enzyme
MSPPVIRVRRLTRTDLPFADTVRALAGWNQTVDDWRRLLRHAPTGCFLAEWNGAPAGTATTTVYGRDLAWIGMVLVHPDYRRRGIGWALLQRCVEHLQERGVRCIKLDATPLGKTMYDRLGFRDEWTLSRWVGSGRALSCVVGRGVPAERGECIEEYSGRLSRRLRPTSGLDPLIACAPNQMTSERRSVTARRRQANSRCPGVPQRERAAPLLAAHPDARSRPGQRTDWPILEELDAAAFGVGRGRLLRALARQSCHALVLESSAGRVAGYGLRRAGARADYLGPIVAASADAGTCLIESLCARPGGETIYWDIPDQNAAAVAWARANGFQVQRSLTRMVLGANDAPGDPHRQFALAGPEVG